MKTNHNPSLRRAIVFLGSVVSLLIAGGCVSQSGEDTGPTETVAWVKGELRAILPYEVETVMNATERAIAELRFFAREEKRDALSAVYDMHNAQDERIRIVVEKQEDHITEMRIRVGVVGNRATSQVIFDTIKGNF